MSEQTLSQQLADFAFRTARDNAPEQVRRSMTDRIKDVIGLQLGALPLETSAAAQQFAAEQGGKEAATAVGLSRKTPAPTAAFVNGVLAHSLDFDDTHLPSILHPSASVVPTALAAAEEVGASGSQIINAAAAGVEIVVRVGMAGYDKASNNSIFFEHGQHATSICGTIGSAVTAGLLYGQNAEQLWHSIGIAASMASGVIEGNRAGGNVKRLHCGWAAQAGISAAKLVNGGFTGPATSLEGRFGLFQAFLHGTYDAAAVTEGLGSDWELPGIFFKPYPANHFTHTAVDAARELRAQGVRPEDIEEIVLGVAGPTVRTIGEPLEVKRNPETGYQAQFSGPYAVALGFLGSDDLREALGEYSDSKAQDPERIALMQKVTVVSDEECNAIYPYQFPAVLRVRLKDGSERIARRLGNRGGNLDPLNSSELSQKFWGNAVRSLAEDQITQLEQQLDSFATLGRVDEIGRILSTAATRISSSTVL